MAHEVDTESVKCYCDTCKKWQHTRECDVCGEEYCIEYKFHNIFDESLMVCNICYQPQYEGIIKDKWVKWDYRDAEARLLDRFNDNQKNLAELKKSTYCPITLEEFRSSMVYQHGTKNWKSLVERESERAAAEHWSNEMRYLRGE
jgi:hypothetical protein